MKNDDFYSEITITSSRYEKHDICETKVECLQLFRDFLIEEVLCGNKEKNRMGIHQSI